MNDVDKKPRAKRRVIPVQPRSKTEDLDSEVMDVRTMGGELGCSAAWASMMVKRTMTKLASITIEGITGEKPSSDAAKTLAVHPEFQNLVVKLLKEKDNQKANKEVV